MGHEVLRNFGDLSFGEVLDFIFGKPGGLELKGTLGLELIWRNFWDWCLEILGLEFKEILELKLWKHLRRSFEELLGVDTWETLES